MGRRISVTEICARIDPSTYSTSECTVDWGCTVTRTFAGGTSKSLQASMTSRPLLSMVAESDRNRPIHIFHQRMHGGLGMHGDSHLCRRNVKEPAGLNDFKTFIEHGGRVRSESTHPHIPPANARWTGDAR